MRLPRPATSTGPEAALFGSSSPSSVLSARQARGKASSSRRTSASSSSVTYRPQGLPISCAARSVKISTSLTEKPSMVRSDCRTCCKSAAWDRFCTASTAKSVRKAMCIHSFFEYFTARRIFYTESWKKDLHFRKSDGRIETLTNRKRRRCFRNAQHQVCKEACQG